MGTYMNFEKKNSMKTKGTYKNFEKIQWKRSFHHQLTKYMGTYMNFEKNSMKTKGTYMNFEKIQWKQSFHQQLTKVNCIKSNNTMKTNQLS